MKTTLSKIIVSALLTTGVAVSLMAAPAQAGGMKPNSTASTGGGDNSTLDKCSNTDISIGGSLGTLVKATDCDGASSGNDTGSGNPLLTRLQNGLFAENFNSNQTVSWSYGGKSEEGEKGLFGFNAKYDYSEGNWGFTTKPTFNTFVVSLKSNDFYSAYLFKDYDWSQGLNGVFNTIGVSTNKQGKAQALSHASLFAANVTTVTPPPAEVPEPTTLVGLGLAFGGMLASRRRQSH
ncbi:PEP-CTERM sorting domain-containing protein [Planktothrix sp. FACHB-1365]|uniref:PEP-CTERM sorting domain-containing protein n=1 Tax=Planktothrix sp. FACHB-1365 TaxID=2692855 RepID=UPI0016831D21|nr:PEP-CTERM sorting domain-containing protein [Planktothrix sp. FACHB-1365]MBD2485269.1 PEP-CTERM sorting domain-containing protein [Planktothrix sp. FACHB-1365]